MELKILKSTDIIVNNGYVYATECPICGAYNQIRIHETGSDVNEFNCIHFHDIIFGFIKGTVIGVFE